MALTKIKADGLTADLIDETKLADNSIDSEHYNDGSIDNAHLADDAVGIAELSATGTASSSTFLRGDNSWTTINTDLVSDTSPQLGGALDTNGSNINFGDSTTNGTTVNRLTFGTATNGDLALWHDGNNSYIVDQGTGELRIRGAEVVKIQDTDSAENMGVFNKNGSVELYHNNVKKLDTRSDGIAVWGAEGGDAQLRLVADEGDDGGDYWRLESKASDNNFNLATYASGAWVDKVSVDTSGNVSIIGGNLDLDDSTSNSVGRVRLGDSSDLQIYHQPSNSTSYLYNTSTDLTLMTGGTNVNIKSDSGEFCAKFVKDGAAELYHNNVKQLETTRQGINLPKGVIQGVGNGSMAIIGGTIDPSQDTTWNFPFNTNHSGSNNGYFFYVRVFFNHWNSGNYFKIMEKYVGGRGNVTSTNSVTPLENNGTSTSSWDTGHFDTSVVLSGDGTLPATFKVTYDAESTPSHTSGYHICVQHSGNMGPPTIS